MPGLDITEEGAPFVAADLQPEMATSGVKGSKITPTSVKLLFMPSTFTPRCRDFCKTSDPLSSETRAPSSRHLFPARLFV